MSFELIYNQGMKALTARGDKPLQESLVIMPSQVPYVGLDGKCCLRKCFLESHRMPGHPEARQSNYSAANLIRGQYVEKRQLAILEAGCRESGFKIEPQKEIKGQIYGLPYHGYIDAVITDDQTYPYAWECKSPASGSFAFTKGKPSISNILQAWLYAEAIKSNCLLEICSGDDNPRTLWKVAGYGTSIVATCNSIIIGGKKRDKIKLDYDEGFEIYLPVDQVQIAFDKIAEMEKKLHYIPRGMLEATRGHAHECAGSGYPCNWNDGKDECKYYQYCWKVANDLA